MISVWKALSVHDRRDLGGVCGGGDTSTGVTEEGREAVRLRVPAPLRLHPRADGGTETGGEILVGEQGDDPVHQATDVSPADHVARLALAYRVRCPARVAGHHGQPGRGGLQVDDAESLDIEATPPGAARHREDVTGGEVRGQPRPRHAPGDHDVVAD